MSKLKTGTKDKILDKALQMFNERGIEYVGLRELAAVLDMRVGNISYYFPTKDDLVYELSLELSKSNSAIIVEKEKLTMTGFLEMLHQVFQNHIKFRCLLLSVVHLLRQNKFMAAAYKKNQKIRTGTIQANLQSLEKAGFLKLADEEEMEFLSSGISLISRFWISEAAVSFRQLSEAEQVQYYLSLIARLVMPYATAKGKRDIRHFLEQVSDRPAV